MKKHILTAGMILGATLLAIAAKNGKDPVLMKINGKDVHVSEFEYLYNKNNSQQIQPQTLDEYVDMFINYKLKVADAEAAGIDTTQAFLKEYEQFRNDLSAPYLRDNSVEDQLVKEAYSHYKDDVKVSHIMLAAEEGSKERADSIRAEILAGRTTFEQAAKDFSVDRASKVRGGLMGFVTPGRFPWAFEKASYDTPVGQISPVVNSGFGFHIIRVEERTPAAGEVEAAHILRLTANKSAEEAAAQKALIDSIYNVAIQPGADFADLARRFSEDPGSGRKGGSLGWFGKGMMVQPFDSISFAMAVGEISKPFATNFGYHIIHKTNSRGMQPLEDMKGEILNKMKGDERAAMPVQKFVETITAKYNAAPDEASLAKIQKMISENAAGLDSTLLRTLAASDMPAFTVGGNAYPVSSVIEPGVNIFATKDAAAAMSGLRHAISDKMRSTMLALERDNLAATNDEYRNLLNEYREGILMYEISNRNVWDKAAKDKEGLEKYFLAHRDKYKWEQPKFKSYIIFASNDSVLNLATAYADSLSTAEPTAFVQDMRKRFGRNVRVDRVIAAKGENAITDFLAFGADKPAPEKGSRWTSYAAYKGRVIDQPEEATDVRGAAVTDYQNELEKLWIEKLRKSYKVKVDKKVLKKIQQAK